VFEILAFYFGCGSIQRFALPATFNSREPRAKSVLQTFIFLFFLRRFLPGSLVKAHGSFFTTKTQTSRSYTKILVKNFSGSLFRSTESNTLNKFRKTKAISQTYSLNDIVSAFVSRNCSESLMEQRSRKISCLGVFVVNSWLVQIQGFNLGTIMISVASDSLRRVYPCESVVEMSQRSRR
jgi:hypothetical protein